jgi:hypothetical protein
LRFTPSFIGFTPVAVVVFDWAVTVVVVVDEDVVVVEDVVLLRPRSETRGCAQRRVR